ncbi:hypothetical protein BV898_02267 [Hypsibius exemplaris]|uniref:Uncharacterized protein n=1 Tax=Hypsibius exemplaris TaxID=2072580 RepID=A0A1W0X8Q6_HYPEX|nr:hypothetical protein BV898_02267 [Hypsibius exemplaris]
MRVSAPASFLCVCFGFFALSFPVLVSGATVIVRPAQFNLEDSVTTAATPEGTTIIGTTITTEETDTTTEGPAVDPTEATGDPGNQASTVSPPKCLVKCRKPTWEEIQQSLHGTQRPQSGRPLGPDWQYVTLQTRPDGQQEAQQSGGEPEEAEAQQQNNQTQVPEDQDEDGDLLDGPDGGPFGPFRPFHGRFGGPSPFFGRFRRFRGPFWRRWKRSVAAQNPAPLHKLFRKRVAGNKFWICEQTC